MQENAHHQVLIGFKLLHLIDWEGVKSLQVYIPFIRWSKLKPVQFWFNLDARKSYITFFTFAL